MVRLRPAFAVPFAEIQLTPCERLNQELEALFLAREDEDFVRLLIDDIDIVADDRQAGRFAGQSIGRPRSELGVLPVIDKDRLRSIPLR